MQNLGIKKEKTMNKALKLIIAITIFSLTLTISTFAQTVEIGSKQSLTVSSPGFFPFSSISNATFKQNLPGNPNLEVLFTNFLGSPCNIAPAADFGEIGSPLMVTGNGNFIIDFSMAGPNAGTFGLSLVPQNGTCIFDILVQKPSISSSSSSSGSIITGNSFFPNSITVVGAFLSDPLVSQLSNDSNNKQCQNSPTGINSTPLTTNQNFIAGLYQELLGRDAMSLNKTIRNLNSKSTENYFTLEATGTKKLAMSVYNQQLSNTTDMVQIYVTGIFPSVAKDSSIMIGSNRVFDSEVEVTLKDQVDPALAAVQHALVSATMPWQLSPNGGHFIIQGGGCVGPYCTIVESGMVVIVPGGACTPEKLSKRRAGYPTVNPSKFFDPFPASSKTIQIPTSDIVNPKHPLVSKVLQDSAYLIFQPVPPGAMLIQQLNLGISDKKKN